MFKLAGHPEKGEGGGEENPAQGTRDSTSADEREPSFETNGFFEGSERDESSKEDRSGEPPEESVVIMLTLRSDPAGASVYLGEEKLGETPYVFQVRADTEPYELMVRKKGYHSKTVLVNPAEQTEYSVVLRKRD